MGEKCVANTKDGNTACNTKTCTPGQWCNTIICEVGCTDTSNCAPGTACDLSNPTEWFGKKVGTCRACSAEQTVVVPEKCGDVKGAYNFNLAKGSSDGCTEVFKAGTQCTMTQTDCKVAVTCGGGAPLNLELDNRNRGKSMASMSGISLDCDFQFYDSPKSLTAACQIVGPGGALVCNLSGAQN
jgi:hypothetical protein